MPSTEFPSRKNSEQRKQTWPVQRMGLLCELVQNECSEQWYEMKENWQGVGYVL